MDASTYWKYQMIATGAMGFLLGLGFHQDNTILIIAAFLIGVSSIVYFRQKVEGPLHDERSATVSTKASAATFSTFTLLSLVVSAVFFYLGNTSNPEYLQWAYGLAFVVCALMILRLFFWMYYTRKYGG
ncbi:MAG: DUF2178 domain-containing protein [Candidatus Bathyarchaeota archaeon]|nr:MAG: DUF2178 domain-containing protein [Candidatus Bathyarchaeota archaeon]